MFTLQKIIWFLTLPPASLIGMVLAGLLLLEKRRALGRGLILAGLALWYFLSLSPVADLILGPLERPFRPDIDLPAVVDAVVVPGGGSVDRAWLDAAAVPNAETFTRLIKGIEVSRKVRAPLVLTGGNGEPFSTRLNDADVMAETAVAMGVPRNRLVVENRSRNTLENSHAVRELINGDRIVLVTSAYYMRRAVGMFEKRGFQVTPVPVYPLVQSRKAGLAFLIPGAGSFHRSTVGIAEWYSMIWWEMRGAWQPRPRSCGITP